MLPVEVVVFDVGASRSHSLNAGRHFAVDYLKRGSHGIVVAKRLTLVGVAFLVDVE